MCDLEGSALPSRLCLSSVTSLFQHFDLLQCVKHPSALRSHASMEQYQSASKSDRERERTIVLSFFHRLPLAE